MWWQKVILSPQNVFHRIFIGHRFAVGEMRLNVAVQCRCQCGFTGAGLSADETQTGFPEHGIQQVRFNIHGEDVRNIGRDHPHGDGDYFFFCC